MEYDFSKRMRDFNMTNPVVVSSTGKGDPIVAYVGEYGGREYAHIRSVYQGKGDVWCPGKGISFPVEEMTDVLLKLAERFVAGDVADADKTLSPQQHYIPPTETLTEAFSHWTTDELRKQVTKSGTASLELKKRMQLEINRREGPVLSPSNCRPVEPMPKMSNGLEGLARLGKPTTKKAAPARFKTENRRSR